MENLFQLQTVSNQVFQYLLFFLLQSVLFSLGGSHLQTWKLLCVTECDRDFIVILSLLFCDVFTFYIFVVYLNKIISSSPTRLWFLWLEIIFLCTGIQWSTVERMFRRICSIKCVADTSPYIWYPLHWCLIYPCCKLFCGSNHLSSICMVKPLVIQKKKKFNGKWKLKNHALVEL